MAQIISSTSFGCPGGPERSNSSWCKIHSASTILTLDVDKWPKPDPSNYWLAEGGKTGKEQGFILYLGCSTTVFGVRLRNTQNAFIQDRSTKKFRILGSVRDNGPWEELLVANLEDARNQELVPLQQLTFVNSAVVSYIKFELLEYWGSGGGLQYLEIISSSPLQPGLFVYLENYPKSILSVVQTMLPFREWRRLPDGAI